MKLSNLQIKKQEFDLDILKIDIIDYEDISVIYFLYYFNNTGFFL